MLLSFLKNFLIKCCWNVGKPQLKYKFPLIGRKFFIYQGHLKSESGVLKVGLVISEAGDSLNQLRLSNIYSKKGGYAPKGTSSDHD